MKLDLDFIKGILLAIDEYERYSTPSTFVIDKLEIDTQDQLSLDKVFHHMKILFQANIIDSSAKNFGFDLMGCGKYRVAYSDYELTIEGHKIVEAIKQDKTLWASVKKGIKRVTPSIIEQIPAISVSILLKHL